MGIFSRVLARGRCPAKAGQYAIKHSIAIKHYFGRKENILLCTNFVLIRNHLSQIDGFCNEKRHWMQNCLVLTYWPAILPAAPWNNLLQPEWSSSSGWSGWSGWFGWFRWYIMFDGKSLIFVTLPKEKTARSCTGCSGFEAVRIYFSIWGTRAV